MTLCFLFILLLFLKDEIKPLFVFVSLQSNLLWTREYVSLLMLVDFHAVTRIKQHFVVERVGAYLRQPHELVDILRQEDHVAVGRYHGDEALQRLQVQTVHLSVLLAVSAAAAAWRDKVEVLTVEMNTMSFHVQIETSSIQLK